MCPPNSQLIFTVVPNCGLRSPQAIIATHNMVAIYKKLRKMSMATDFTKNSRCLQLSINPTLFFGLSKMTVFDCRKLSPRIMKGSFFNLSNLPSPKKQMGKQPIPQIYMFGVIVSAIPSLINVMFGYSLGLHEHFRISRPKSHHTIPFQGLHLVENNSWSNSAYKAGGRKVREVPVSTSALPPSKTLPFISTCLTGIVQQFNLLAFMQNALGKSFQLTLQYRYDFSLKALSPSLKAKTGETSSYCWQARSKMLGTNISLPKPRMPSTTALSKSYSWVASISFVLTSTPLKFTISSPQYPDAFPLPYSRVSLIVRFVKVLERRGLNLNVFEVHPLHSQVDTHSI